MRALRIAALLCGTAATWFVLHTANRAVERRLATRAERVTVDAVTAAEHATMLAVGSDAHAPADWLAPEALAFRTRPEHLAAPPDAERRADAHPRTLAGYRALRAYPGAPPRVPHGLTADELARDTCNTCHARGGYSARFGSYVPITPHPELDNCLQCHTVDAAIVGAAPQAGARDALCRQCHAPAAPRERTPALAWRPLDWPARRGASSGGAPPDVPHDLRQRGNCIACHVGPAAVAEVRVTHADHAHCRQCHLVPFDETGAIPTAGAGGTR